ncbi:MAG: hypothetical protein AAGH99_10070 [Planctomycetota bacterium]
MSLTTRLISAVACVVWGLGLTGCVQSYAQRSASQWVAVRALVEADLERDFARAKPTGREDFYTLTREVSGIPESEATEIATFYLLPGDPLGFTATAQGEILAVAGNERQALDPEIGVTFVWYREKDPFSFLPNAAEQSLWLALGIIGLVALVIVIGSDGDGTVNISF